MLINSTYDFNSNAPKIYLFKDNNRYIGKRCEICWKLTIKYQNDVNDVDVNVTPFSTVSIVDFEQVNVSWEAIFKNILTNVLDF